MLRYVCYLLFVFLTGCLVGPHFRSPQAPCTTRYTHSSQPTHTVASSVKGGAVQIFNIGEDIPAQWWRLFHSLALNCLIERGLANNPSLESALATLRQSQQNYLAELGATMMPKFDSQFTAEREQTSLLASGINLIQRPNQPLPFKIGTLFNLFNASVGVAYNLDFFGGTRRHIEAMRASVEYQKFQLQAAYLTLTSNIVTTAINIASLREQINISEKIIISHKRQLKVLTESLQLGHVSRLDLINEKEAAQQSEILLTGLKTSLAKQENALAVLIGSLPSEAQIPYLNLKDMHLPTHLPVSLPCALVQQRPDIRSTEALLHKACAEIGVATADLFPKINLSANFGYTGGVLSTIFKPANKVWDYSSLVTLPIFHGGELVAKRRAAIAEYEYAYAQYRKMVLEAFQNVADVLKALEYDAERLKAYADIQSNALTRLHLMQNQYEFGKASYSSLLSAKQQYNDAEINRIKAEATRLADTAALFQALGGGWWNITPCKVRA